VASADAGSDRHVAECTGCVLVAADRARPVFDLHSRAVLLELVRLVRDELGRKPLLGYIKTLPEQIAQHPLVLEQRWLA
jgi:hypothetical protein